MECNKQHNCHFEQNPDHSDEQTSIENKARVEIERLKSSHDAWASENREPSTDFDQIVKEHVVNARVSYQKERENRELAQHFVRWDRITEEDIFALEETLNSNPHEQAMHRFLEDNRKFLIQALSGGHGRYQISKPQLGSEFVPDFLVAEMDSIGIHWTAVELESPRVRGHRNDGLQSSKLTHAIGQIRDWRAWIRNNIDYARRPPEQNGLGLIGIDDRAPGLVLIGRRDEFPERYNEFRRQMQDREGIAIHSFDWLVDVARRLSGVLSVDLREYRKYEYE